MSLVSQSILSMYPPVPDATDALVSTGTAISYTVPAGCALVIFGTDTPGDVFTVRKGGTAAFATVTVIDGTASFPNPAGFVVSPGDVFSVFAASGVNVYIARYGADTAKIWR